VSILFKKLNLGTHTVALVLNAPKSFEPELATLKGVTIKRSVSGTSAFAMAFVITQAELDAASRKLVASCTGDAILWMVYPKGTSRKYRCEFNRDSGWPILGAAGFEPVRMVAIDEDWSALRFRRVEHIKRMTRGAGNSISKAGKKRASTRSKT
jgi:hypothetical protein